MRGLVKNPEKTYLRERGHIMPREPRNIPTSGILHIIIRGNNKKALFIKKCDYKNFLTLLLTYKIKHKFLLYHYCLMKNHVHLCIEIDEKTNISKMMQGLQISYYYHYRRRYKYIGHLFQDRFKCKTINSEEYFSTAALYIEKNPFEAGIVNDPSDYDWSSYKYYATDENNHLLNMSPFYEELGQTSEERQATYKELMAMNIKLSKENKKRKT